MSLRSCMERINVIFGARRVSCLELEGFTPLPYSPAGLDLELAKRDLEVNSGARFGCLGDQFEGVFQGPSRQL